MADATIDKKSTTLQIIETIATLLTAAFGFVAALAWNEAIKTLVQEYVKAGDQLGGLLIYAVVVTVIAVVATIWIGRVLARYRSLDLKAPRPGKGPKST